MASPPTLPINSQPTTGAPLQMPVAMPEFCAFLSRLSLLVRHGFLQHHPWLELLDWSAMARPLSLSEAYSRIRKNLTYFRVNYVTLLALVLALSLFIHPFSLLVLLSLLSAWAFLYLFRPSDHPLVILGCTFSDTETLVGLVLLTMIIVFVSNVGSFLISALLIGLAIICVHCAFRVPEDLFPDNQEPANAGFL